MTTEVCDIPAPAEFGEGAYTVDEKRVRWWQQITAALREDWILFVILGLYIGTGYAIQSKLDQRTMYVWEFSRGLGWFTVTYMVCYVAYRLIRGRSRDGVTRVTPGQAWQDIKGDFVHGRLIVGYLMISLIVPRFSGTFLSFKQTIPKLNPFCWDQTFCRWDQWLHFGRHPYEWLQPVLGWPIVTEVFNSLYSVWLAVLVGVVLSQAWRRDRLRRRQFFVTYMLCWIVLGTVLATWWSSAGPCYYHHFVSVEASPYTPLLDYLEEVKATFPNGQWALRWRDDLWQAYLSDAVTRVKGISAMPSLHVSMSVLFALVGYSFSRRAGRWLTAYAVMILIGSVHLSWHYAIDGYVSIALTILIWKLVGAFLRRFSHLAEPAARWPVPDPVTGPAVRGGAFPVKPAPALSNDTPT